jgi:hypothetical protein
MPKRQRVGISNVIPTDISYGMLRDDRTRSRRGFSTSGEKSSCGSNRHYNTVLDMGHSEVPLMFNNMPLNIFRGTLKCASFIYAPKSFWSTLIEVVPLIKFN